MHPGRLRNMTIAVSIVLTTAWLGLRIKRTADETFTLVGRYPLARVDMTPSACIIHPVQGTSLGSVFNFYAFDGFRPDGSRAESDDNSQRLPSLDKFGTTFDAFNTRYGRVEVGNTAGGLADGSSYHHGLLYLYPRTSDLSQFLPQAVLVQLPPITDRQIGIMNSKGDAELIIEIKGSRVTFVRWCWEQ